MSCTESQTCSSLTPMDAVLDDIVRLSLPTPGRTFTLFNTFSFHRPLHHSIPSHSPFSLPPFLPAPEKLLLFVIMFCSPAASAHSLPPLTSLVPLISCFSNTKQKRIWSLFLSHHLWRPRPHKKTTFTSLILFYTFTSPFASNWARACSSCGSTYHDVT